MVRPADLENPALARLQLQCLAQILQQIFNRDRAERDDTQRGATMTGSGSLRARIISKDREPEPMTIEARSSMTSTPAARKTPPTSRRLRRRGESGPRFAEPAQIDDLFHSGSSRGISEIPSRMAIFVFEVAARAHRMDQVIGGLHPLHGPIKTSWVERVTRHDLRLRRRSGA